MFMEKNATCIYLTALSIQLDLFSNPLLLAIRGPVVQSARRLLPAHYATAAPINSRGSVTFSFERFILRWGTRLLQPRPARSWSGLKFRGCKYRRSGQIPGNHFRSASVSGRFAGRCEESVRLYRRFLFYVSEIFKRENMSWKVTYRIFMYMWYAYTHSYKYIWISNVLR